MFSGNTYTFMYIEKYNIHNRPKVTHKKFKKPQPTHFSKPKLQRTSSHARELNQLYDSSNEDKENCQTTSVSDNYQTSLGLEMWSSSWE